MIGEIRDYETLETAINASITGHLVLSTIHTNSAASTVTRLIEMGAPAHLIGSAIEGVVSQRLVRKLCPKCKEIYEPSEKELRYITVSDEDRKDFINSVIYKPKQDGCDHCNGSGYAGRMGIY